MGKVIMSGIVPQLEAPITGILASTLAVGSSVYLLESGSPVEYLVINQGIPSNSSLYDSSCDGMWLLRKDIYTKIYPNDWDYEESATHTYLNGTFLGLFDSDTQSAIKQAKIPYIHMSYPETLYTGANGLSTKVFLLSADEIGLSWTKGDGAVVSYFSGAADSKRIGYYNGTATDWWTRSSSYNVSTSGGSSSASVSDYKYGVRPALILPSTALFDKNTLEFKGVK